MTLLHDLNPGEHIFWQVDGDTSTNDAVIALASGLSESHEISSLNSSEAEHLQNCLDAVCAVISFICFILIRLVYLDQDSVFVARLCPVLSP